MTLLQSRRQNLMAGLAALFAGIWGVRLRAARADVGRVNMLISQFTGGKTAITGKVHLEFPDASMSGSIAAVEDGNVVLMNLTVESPMSDASYVTDVLVVADGNSRPTIVTFHFTPECGIAEASTRIRLAKTVTLPNIVTAVAKMSDGSCYQVAQQVNVLNTGCG